MSRHRQLRAGGEARRGAAVPVHQHQPQQTSRRHGGAGVRCGEPWRQAGESLVRVHGQDTLGGADEGLREKRNIFRRRDKC